MNQYKRGGLWFQIFPGMANTIILYFVYLRLPLVDLVR